MSMTPDDILQKEFETRFRGYDREEVEEFLEEVAQAMTEIIKERNELRDEIVALHAQVEQARAEGDEIRKAIAAAHKMSDDMKEQARKEADLIVEQAKMDAERIVADAHKEAVQLEERIRKLRMMQREAVERIRGSFESYLRMLDEEMALPPADVDETLRLAAAEVRTIQAESIEDAEVAASGALDRADGSPHDAGSSSPAQEPVQEAGIEVLTISPEAAESERTKKEMAEGAGFDSAKLWAED